jgi:hypothetical protein
MKNVLREDAEQFAQFIQKHYPEAQSWKDPIGYCAWYISHFFIAAVCDEDTKEIIAIGAARPVDRPGMGVLPCYFNEKGTCLHIDLLVDVSPNLNPIIAFREMCKMRFPQCKTVAMFRHYESNIRVYPIDKFWRSLEKIKKTKVKKEYQNEPASI